MTLDNFMDPGDGSMDGWSWSMRGRVTNTETLTQQINYAFVNRGLSYEGEGQNRNIPSNLNTTAARDFFFDPTGATTPYSNNTASLKGGTADILAGDGDHAATDGPTGYQEEHRSEHALQPAQRLRTIEDILGTDHINLNTYYTRPMANVFDINASPNWTFTAQASTLLKQTTLLAQGSDDKNKVQFAEGPDLKLTHNAKYWAARTRAFDFSTEDRVPADLYNKILWEGIKGTRAPVPQSRFQMLPKDSKEAKAADRDDDKDGK